ncbi:MAG: insulinase family protein [Nanoarchaeota archaeon]|nr:insulinase family protein [Nanoarchaeota archaeon]MCG2718839.1 insulinase family protein [Nanoarchaeota archaeon]
MKRFILRNGLTVLLKQKPTNSVAVEITVKVGSNNEPLKLKGISHFIEHMLFEGTETRNARELANEIERLGGEINAFTSNERTGYYVVVLYKHFDKALEILADMFHNPLFDEKMIEKERKVILDEVNMTYDDPKIHQWYLFQELMYKKHPCRYPAYGTRKSVLNLKKDDLVKFYKENYIPNNIIISIAGNIDEKVALKKVQEAFSKPKKTLPIRETITEPKQTKDLKKIEKRKISQSYMVYGYRTVPRGHPDSFILDVIKSILGRGQSSKMFNEIRTKRGLAYSVGFHYEAGLDYGWVAVYAGTNKKNIKKIKEIILKEIEELKNVSTEELNDAINFIEGDYLLSNEDNQSIADTMVGWEMINKPELLEGYVNKIKKVKKEDIKKVVNRYFKKSAHVIIQQV